MPVGGGGAGRNRDVSVADQRAEGIARSACDSVRLVEFVLFSCVRLKSR